MSINRHNYESFFLLYADNELIASERKMVELFVQGNTDLATELLLLLDTALPIEKISFNAKDLLYKNFSKEEALLENLVLHLDDELDPLASREMEKAIASDDFVKKEWNILLKTKLQAEKELVFENKDLLYRREKGRIISIRFLKVAAAAAVFIACLFTGIALFKNNKTPGTETATGTKNLSSEMQINNSITSDKRNISSLKSNDPGFSNSLIKEKDQKNTTETTVSNQNSIIVKDGSVDDSQLINKEKFIATKTSLENINKQKSNEIITATVLNKSNDPVQTDQIPVETASNIKKDHISVTSVTLVDYNSVQATPDSYTKTTAMNEMNPADNKISYMNVSGTSRSRIGGLFRKVKRVIERNTNIVTGDGITVAGFEIALNR